MYVKIGNYDNKTGVRPAKVRIDPQDTWSAYSTLAQVIVPMLEAYKADHEHGVWGFCLPQLEPTEADWAVARATQNEIMDNMIFAFSAFLPDTDPDREEDPRVQVGLALFAKHFRHLWT
jgi:hypothetical protein